MQIKATAYLIEWLKLKRLTVPSAGEIVEELELLYTDDGNVICYNTLEILGPFLKKLNTYLPIIQSFHPRE